MAGYALHQGGRGESTAIAFGLWSPVASIVGGLVGLITLAFIGLFTPITMTFIIIAIIMGVAIGIKVKQ